MKANKFVINGVVTRNDGITVRVLVARKKRHPKYNKSFTISKSFFATADADHQVKVGEAVVLEPTRKNSKSKAWRIK